MSVIPTGIRDRVTALPIRDFLAQWLLGRFTKVALKSPNEAGIRELYVKAVEAGLPAALIVDSGLTEFDYVPTVTCVGIGPGDPAIIDSITGQLKLL